MRIIDADALKHTMIETLEALLKNPKMDNQEAHLLAAFHTVGKMIDDAPTVEPTLYGYPIEHLEMIARVMAKENCTPEVVAEMLQNVGNVVRMVRDEMLEMLEESVSMI